MLLDPRTGGDLPPMVTTRAAADPLRVADPSPVHGPAMPASLARPPRRKLGRAAFIVGVALSAVIALDWSTLANPAAFVIALAAHGSLAVFVALLVEEYRADRARPGHQHGRKLPWFLWASATGGFLFIVDRYIRDAPIDLAWRITYFVLALATMIGVLWVCFLLASPNHLNDNAALDALARHMTYALRWLSFGLLAVLLLLTGLAWWRQSHSAVADAEIPAVSVYAGTYVALGDSYAAGEGLAPFLPGPQEDCHRSPYAYPLLLTFDVPADAQPVRREFRACSGAVTSDIDLGITGGHEPQLPVDVRTDVSLVTLSVGGNDVVFSRVVQACFLYEDCVERHFEPPPLDPARPTIDFPDAQPLDEWAQAAMVLLADTAGRVYADVRTTYPEARIVVVGYPHLFPADGSVWRLSDCASVLSRVGENERAGLRELTDALNDALHRRAFQAGLEFVSPAAVWEGHEPCGNADQYTNAVKPVPQLLNPVDGGSFHPNRRGQQELARLVACYLTANATAPAFRPGMAPGSLAAPVPCAP